MAKKLDAKTKFNALSTAQHIFALKEEGTPIKLIEMYPTENDCKAVFELENGEIGALFTDSKSAKSALQDVINVFGDDQPFIKIHIRETAKKQSVYYVEVQ